MLAGVAEFDRAGAELPSGLPDTVDAYGMVFDQWVKAREPKSAILVVRRDGNTVFAKGSGADPQKPTLIASLSKAITGVCIATLVRDGKLSFTTPLRDALPSSSSNMARRSIRVSIRRRSRNCWRIAPGCAAMPTTTRSMASSPSARAAAGLGRGEPCSANIC